jgi:hypothetical protein
MSALPWSAWQASAFPGKASRAATGAMAMMSLAAVLPGLRQTQVHDGGPEQLCAGDSEKLAADSRAACHTPVRDA